MLYWKYALVLLATATALAACSAREQATLPTAAVLVPTIPGPNMRPIPSRGYVRAAMAAGRSRF